MNSIHKRYSSYKYKEIKMQLIVSGTITIDPTKADKAISAMTAMMAETHKESGNLAYNFAQNLSDPSIFHVYEKWESQEALDIHMKTPHMETFMASMGDFGVTDASILKHEISNEAPLF